VPSDDAALTAAAIGRWNHALRCLSETDPALERLRTLTMVGRPFCSVARPHLMTPVRYEAERLAVTLVGAALSKVSAAIARTLRPALRSSSTRKRSAADRPVGAPRCPLAGVSASWPLIRAGV
jgi:hypothetical protein